MTHELLAPLILFCLATLFTPGPNNLMLMASVANFGLVRTLPHLAGVALGFPGMVVVVGLGASQAFARWPATHWVMSIASGLFMLWLAWKIATAGTAPEAGRSGGRPLRMWQAAAFQWVNPKAWSMALSAITLYAPGRDLGAVLWVAGTFAALGLCSSLSWASLGLGIRRFLANPVRLRWFNRAMAALLLAAMAPLLLP